MVTIKDREITSIVEQHAVELINDYYVWVLSDGVTLVPFGDFVEVYYSVEVFKAMNPQDPE